VNTLALRRALGHFATGVTVVTARVDAQCVGITATSFNSVSLEPPLILWSLSKKSRSYPVFQTASHFAVNILAEDQLALAQHFAQATQKRFDGVAHHAGIGGCLLLDGSSAHFQCETFQILEGGDHWIFLGKVVAFAHHGHAPLIHHRGAYAALQPVVLAPDLDRGAEKTLL